MTIQLSDDKERLVHSLMQKGHYASADEVIDDALKLLSRQRAGHKPLTEAEFDRYLLDAGLMSQLPDSEADFDDPDDQLIAIRGEPLSETVIRERR